MAKVSSKRWTIDKAMKLINECEVRGFSEWAKEAKSSYEIYNGYQWPDSDLKVMQKEKRPTICFNEAAPLIDAFVGYEIQNRKEVKFYARQDQGAEEADVMQDVADWARQTTNQERAEIDAEKDMAICGIGVTDTRMDYSESELGQLMVDRGFPLDHRWDLDARAKNLTDRRWDSKYKIFTKDELLEVWPDAEIDNISENYWPSNDLPQVGHLPVTYERRETTTGSGKKGYKVWDFQYYINVPFYKVENPFKADPEMFQMVLQDLIAKFGEEAQHDVMNLDEDQFALLKKLTKRLGLESPDFARLTRKQYYRVFFIDSIKYELQHTRNAIEGFTREFITGKRDEKDGMWYGIMRPLKDPQMYLNKMLSSILYTYMTNSKGGIIIDDSAIIDFEELRHEWAKPNPIIRVNNVEGIKERNKADIGTAAPQLVQMFMAAIPKVGGMNPEMLAAGTGDKANSLVQTRISQSLTLLAELIDSMTAYRINWGRKLVKFTKNYLCQEERIMRINSDEGMKFINLINDPLADDYDIYSEEGPITMNQRIEIWQVLSQVFQGQPMPPPLLKYLPLPKPVIMETMQYMQQQSQPNPLEQAQQQADTQLTQAETVKAQALAENTKARTAKVVTDIEHKHTDQAIKMTQAMFTPPQNPMQQQTPPNQGIGI